MATLPQETFKSKDTLREVEALNSNSSLRNVAYWESTLFSPVYLTNDLKRDFSDKWEKDFDDEKYDDEGNSVKSGFYHFYVEFRNIAKSLRGLSNKKLSESDTIGKIIVPLLDALGWYDKCFNNVEEPFATETSFTVKGTPKDKTFRTDLILVDAPQEATFISNNDNADKRKKEARQYCIAPLEAKYWNRIVDREKSNLREDSDRADKEGDDTSSGSTYNEQILNYMEILQRKWGIITDGNIWRLLNSEVSGELSRRCFEFKMESLLDQEAKVEAGQSDESEFLENAKYFYLFFGKNSYVKDDSGRIFLDDVLTESRKYIDSIEEDLKDRFISAMNITCDGLLKAAQSEGTFSSPSDEDLKLIRTVAESHLFNILFIKSCEARSVLPIKAPSYYDVSLTSIFDRISVFEPEKYSSDSERSYIDDKLSSSLKVHKYSSKGTNLYKNLIRLTAAIHRGASKDDFGFEINGFKETVFSDVEWEFAKKYSLTDREMVQTFFELGYSKASSSSQRNYQQIPYNYFTPRQLGSIYESFLEFKLEIAKHPMVYVEKGKKKKYRQWVRLTAKVQKQIKGHEPKVRPGQAFFTPNNSDRKATGSYYTPDYVVQYIVEESLGHLCDGKDSRDLLRLKVCDPAMGSGHFLIGALNYITPKYVAALENEVEKDKVPSKDEARRTVLENCLYGVDINPRAVKLAKMSLWLESALPGEKLENLEGQLICADSLKTENIWQTETSLNQKAFNCIVGNPPYVNIEKIPKADRQFYLARYGNNSSLGKRYDLYQIFVLRSLELLCDGGAFGMILPNTFLLGHSYKLLRSKLVKETEIVEIVDLPQGVFEGVTIDNVIILFNGSRPKKTTKIKVKKLLAKSSKTRLAARDWDDAYPVLQGEISEADGFKINVNSNPIADRVFEKIVKQSVSLGSLVEVSQGIILYKTEEDAERGALTSDNAKVGWKKLLRGREIGRYRLNWKGEYVKYCDQLWSPREEKYFSKAKILFQAMRNKSLSRRLVGTLDDERYYNAHNLSNIILKSGVKYDLKFILGYFNSAVMNLWFKGHYSNVNVNPSDVREIPIRKIDFSKKSDVELHSRVVEIVTKMIDLNSKISDAVEKRREILESKVRDLDRQLNRLIEESFSILESDAAAIGLTEECAEEEDVA